MGAYGIRVMLVLGDVGGGGERGGRRGVKYYDGHINEDACYDRACFL